MKISKKADTPTCNINLNNHPLEQVRSFKYLGTCICCDGKSPHEIKSEGASEKSLHELIKDTDQQVYNIKTRKRILGCYVEPVMTYGSEAWTIKAACNIINAAELWFLRRMPRIPYTEHVTNEAVLAKAGVKRSLLVNINKRQARFFGHIMRVNELEHQLTTGKISGNRSGERQRVKRLDGLTKWTEKATSNEVIHTE